MTQRGPHPSSIPAQVKVSSVPAASPASSASPSSTPASKRTSSKPPVGQGASSASEDYGARIESRRAAGARVVIALYRSVKVSQLYDAANEAVRQTTGPVLDAIHGFCSAFDTDQIKVLFSKDQVFVQKRMMRAPREMYAMALTLGAMLEHCELNEIVLERTVGGDSVQRLTRLIADSQRDARAAAALREDPLPGVSTRKVSDVDIETNPDESAIARVVKAYAASILILQSFHSRLATGDHRGANDVKRIAQKLVALSEVHAELLVATATGAFPDDDPARAAVSTAVIVLAMAKMLTEDRRVLSTVVQAALLANCGTARHGLSPDPASLPARTFGVLAAIGEFYPASVRRSVVACEALQMEDGAGDLCLTSEQATVLGGLLSTARRFNALRMPRLGAPRATLDLAIKQLGAATKDRQEQSRVRLLVSALGFYPSGTVVELDTGELALVAGVPATALDFARPPIHIMTDAHKQFLSKPIEVDLARQASGGQTRAILRPVDLDRLKASQARA
jgi:hypothetical protein